LQKGPVTLGPGPLPDYFRVCPEANDQAPGPEKFPIFLPYYCSAACGDDLSFPRHYPLENFPFLPAKVIFPMAAKDFRYGKTGFLLNFQIGINEGPLEQPGQFPPDTAFSRSHKAN
jgi:hypothetical protein